MHTASSSTIDPCRAMSLIDGKPIDAACVDVQAKTTTLQLAIAGSAIALHGIPWLINELYWCGWLGMACGLYLVTQSNWLSTWWATWLWASLSIAIAFHWSPGAMAYTLGSDYGVGLAVATPLILWDGLRLSATYWLAARVTCDLRIIWLPAALIAILIESFVPSVFPWRLGLMQLAMPFILQPVDILGASWSTLIAFTITGLLLVVVRRVSRQLRTLPPAGDRPPALHPMLISGVFVLALFLLAFCIVYGTISYKSMQSRIASSKSVRFGLVQVDPSYTWSLEKTRELTQSIAADVDIMCWPESSGGNYDVALTDLSNPQEVFEHSREPERGLQPWPAPSCELLLGGKTYSGDLDHPHELYVTAMLIDESERIRCGYNKRFLMPFGEYVPGEKWVPGMAQLFDMAEHVQPGAGASTILSSTGANIGVMLCYEDMVPEASIDASKIGANVLVSLINGSAFESRFALSQHRLLAQLRSIECRKYFLRCAATGETCVISPLGNIVQRIPMQEPGVIVADIPLLDGQTSFARLPWLSPILATLTLGGFLFAVRKSRLIPGS